MATIGLDRLYYSVISEDSNGDETFAVPMVLAKAISADISVEVAEAILYADDGASEAVKEFKSGTISLNIDDLGATTACNLLGIRTDRNGVVISSAEDTCNAVAIGFRAKRSNGKYRYFWIYKVKFSAPGTSLATKGDSITFNTPTIEGTILRLNKADSQGNHL